MLHFLVPLATNMGVNYQNWVTGPFDLGNEPVVVKKEIIYAGEIAII